MKKLLVALAAVLVSAATYGQGQVQFENFTIPNAQIFLQDGTTGVGPDGRVQLFLPSGTALGSPQPFEESSPGFFFAGIVDVPGVAPGATQSFIVRAWQGGATFDASPLRAEVTSGEVTVGGGTITPNSVPFESFALIPEPSTLALGLIGAGALLLRRRK